MGRAGPLPKLVPIPILTTGCRIPTEHTEPSPLWETKQQPVYALQEALYLPKARGTLGSYERPMPYRRSAIRLAL